MRQSNATKLFLLCSTISALAAVQPAAVEAKGHNASAHYQARVRALAPTSLDERYANDGAGPQLRPRQRVAHARHRSRPPVNQHDADARQVGGTDSGPRDLRHYARAGGGDGTSRSCLTGAARALLGRIEANFGAVRIVSTCRPGAVIAGTRHPSMHRYGMAIDFVAPSGRKGEIVSWLARNNSGGTMTYPSMNHIHADVGPYHFVSLAGHRAHSQDRRVAKFSAVTQ